MRETQLKFSIELHDQVCVAAIVPCNLQVTVGLWVNSAVVTLVFYYSFL